MEKRRLLLVVMLLATGAAWAGSGDEGEKAGATTTTEVTVETGKASKTQRAKNKMRGFWKTFKFRIKRSKKNLDEKKYVDAALEVTAAPGDAVLHVSASSFFPCLEKKDSRLVTLTLSGVSLGLAVALYKTAKSKQVQDGVKKIWRGVRRTFRTQAPEKRTDGKAVEA